jgi:hypothetical protein
MDKVKAKAYGQVLRLSLKLSLKDSVHEWCLRIFFKEKICGKGYIKCLRMFWGYVLRIIFKC